MDATVSQRIQDRPLEWPEELIRRVDPTTHVASAAREAPQEAAKRSHREDAAKAASAALQAVSEAVAWLGVTDPEAATASRAAVDEVRELVDRIAVVRGEARPGRGRSDGR